MPHDYIIPARFFQDDLAKLRKEDYWKWVKQIQEHKRDWLKSMGID